MAEETRSKRWQARAKPEVGLMPEWVLWDTRVTTAMAATQFREASHTQLKLGARLKAL